MHYDPHPVNYSYDSEDNEKPETNIQLLDNDLLPWHINHESKEVTLYLNFKEFAKDIEGIEDKQKRDLAYSSLSRLKALLENELATLPSYEIFNKRNLP